MTDDIGKLVEREYIEVKDILRLAQEYKIDLIGPEAEGLTAVISFNNKNYYYILVQPEPGKYVFEYSFELRNGWKTT